MPDFDRLFEELSKAQREPRRDSSQMASWILIIGLIFFAAGTAMTFSIFS